MFAKIIVSAVLVEGSGLPSQNLKNSHASASYVDSNGYNKVSTRFLSHYLGCDLGRLITWAASGDRCVWLEWAFDERLNRQTQSRHLLSIDGGKDIVFGNDRVRDLASGLFMHILSSWASHHTDKENSIDWESLRTEQEDCGERHLVAIDQPDCHGRPSHLQTPKHISTVPCLTTGSSSANDTSSICPTTQDDVETQHRFNAKLPLRIKDTEEDGSKIDLCDAAVQQQVLKEMEYRAQREAELEYRRTGDTSPYRDLLGPFLPSGDERDQKRPVWIWSQSVQKWYSEDPKTKKIVWDFGPDLLSA